MLRRLLTARRTRIEDQLTFVLPVTLKESQRLGDAAGWRSSVDGVADLRLRFCLISLMARFRLRDLCELIIICPANELDDIEHIVREVTSDERVRVVPELEICPDIIHAIDPGTGSMKGWYVQQMLKLAVAEQVSTPFYVTLDSDVVCVRGFSSASLIRDGRGACGMEDAETYENLYTAEFAQRELRVKEGRITAARELLGSEREERYLGRYPSETPVLLNTAAVMGMCEHLSNQHDRPWQFVLAEGTGWTEYALYFSYLEMTGRLEATHEVAGHNRVLHLEGSVWHVSDRYFGPRRYDAEHFCRLREGDDGPFIAIQSWLDTEKWLPATGFETLAEFYRHVADVLGLDFANLYQ